MEANNREVWVDYVKVIACILVAAGHLFQSMVSANIMADTNLYGWFIKTIYYFHVPLFFICSGYLYQKFTKIDSFKSYGKNVLKKLLALGVPYFVFTSASWLLKFIFSDSVNSELNYGLLTALFLRPIQQYWYLYCLFLIFLITPTFKNIKMTVAGLILAVAMKITSFYTGGGVLPVYAVNIVLQNEIWFVLGMALSSFNLYKYFGKKLSFFIGLGCGAVFLAVSIIVYVYEADFNGMSWLLGTVACVSTVSVMAYITKSDRKIKFFSFLSRYTMPVFVMHTIFAAGIRAVLLKIGIENAAVHIIFGLLISFVGPILAAYIMRKTKWLEFLLYPTKFIKIK